MGSGGLVGDVIVRRLRAVGFLVDALERGDDVVDRIRRFEIGRKGSESDDDRPSADAVGVLEAVAGSDADYSRALDAVAEAGVGAARIVVVTPTGVTEKERGRRASAREK